MSIEGVLTDFKAECKDHPNLSPAVLAMKGVFRFLEETKSGTMQELTEGLEYLKKSMTGTDKCVLSISSGLELLIRHISRASLEDSDLSVSKKTMVLRARDFLNRALQAREKISRLGHTFIQDGAKILTHSCSQVVLQTLEAAAKQNKRFHVFVTQSAPDNSGEETKQKLDDLNIPNTIILDSAVGYIMEQVDLVLVGAESVVESGGIINKIGSYGVAVCAKAHNKPLYVAAESFKFRRLYPLNQKEIPFEFKYRVEEDSSEDTDKRHPWVDYTPPSYITLLFTDLAILTPSAVSDELIKLYI